MAIRPFFNLEVASIPAVLIKGGGSVHASSMFSSDENDEVAHWFENNLVRTTYFDLPNVQDIEFGEIAYGASQSFVDHIEAIKSTGFMVWDVQNQQHASAYLNLNDQHGNVAVLSGRADYFITIGSATKATYQAAGHLLCVIEIQSKRNVFHCELQLRVYLLILMNARALPVLWGALIESNGNCRMFKASRGNDNNCIYEHDSEFHVSHFAEVFRRLV